MLLAKNANNKHPKNVNVSSLPVGVDTMCSAQCRYILMFSFVAVRVRLQRPVLERDGNPVHRAARSRPGRNFRSLCEGDLAKTKTET